MLDFFFWKNGIRDRRDRFVLFVEDPSPFLSDVLLVGRGGWSCRLRFEEWGEGDWSFPLSECVCDIVVGGGRVGSDGVEARVCNKDASWTFDVGGEYEVANVVNESATEWLDLVSVRFEEDDGGENTGEAKRSDGYSDKSAGGEVGGDLHSV